MAQYEIGGTSRVSVSSHLNFYQYYSNGILKLSEGGDNLLDLLPTSWHLGPFVRILQEAIGQEFERVERAYEDVRDQLFVETATWGLKYWEQMLGLPVRSGLSAADLLSRRTLILVALARDTNVSEFYFLAGLQALAGPDVTLTLRDPIEFPYSIKIEVPIDYYENRPDVTLSTATSVVAGAIPAGDYVYRVSFRFGSGETDVSPTDIVCATFAGSRNINLAALPLGASGALGRRIWRQKANEKIFALTFQGTLANTNVAQVTVADVDLTGGADTVTPSTVTQGGGGVNEVQKVVVDATAGNFTITYAGQTTANILHNASAATVQSAMEALSSVGVGNMAVAKPDYTFIAEIANNSDTIYLDTTPTSSILAMPTANSAKTALALQIEDFVIESKPAHIHAEVGSTGFQAGVHGAGDEL